MNKYKKGYSLIEILVVLGIFAVLATLATQAVSLTLRGAKKSESSIKVKENLNYSLAVMERQLRNARIITGCSAAVLNYDDKLGDPTSFSCAGASPDFYVASGSARLTSTEIVVNPCSITCNADWTSVTIDLTGTSSSASGIENTTETVTSTIILRQGN